MMYKSQLQKIDPYDWFCGPGSRIAFRGGCLLFGTQSCKTVQPLLWHLRMTITLFQISLLVSQVMLPIVQSHITFLMNMGEFIRKVHFHLPSFALFIINPFFAQVKNHLKRIKGFFFYLALQSLVSDAILQNAHTNMEMETYLVCATNHNRACAENKISASWRISIDRVDSRQDELFLQVSRAKNISLILRDREKDENEHKSNKKSSE